MRAPGGWLFLIGIALVFSSESLSMQTETATPEQVAEYLADRGKVVLTFVGYSGSGYEDEAGMLAEARAVLELYPASKTLVSIGATPDGIGRIYPLAKELGFETVGVVSIRARESEAEISEHVDRVFFIEDESWGGLLEDCRTLAPTSRAVVEPSDVVVAIGGGGVARDELAAARRLGKATRFIPADMNHRKALEKANRRGQQPPDDFRGDAHAVFAADEVERIPFHRYEPPATLVAPRNPVTRSRFPFIDVHSHQFQMADQDLDQLIIEMDKLNMAVMVNLSGRGFRRVQQEDGSFRFALQEPDYLRRAVENARSTAPGRFVVFTNIDFSGIDEPGWGERTAAGVEEDVRNGAQGLKIYKNLGMDARDAAGERIPVDDPRIDPVWARCGELGIPVLIHSADPFQFWQPKDGRNERLYELIERPGRLRDPETNPPFEQILAEQHNVFRRHPGTQFINAHLGWLGNDLARLGRLLDELPNVTTEIGAVLAELGRQPRFAAEWLTRYQDRVLFGKDAWAPDEYHVYFRTLETADDYFDYYRKRHAFWKIYGLDLPDQVLRKIYYENALRIIPGIDSSLFPD